MSSPTPCIVCPWAARMKTPATVSCSWKRRLGLSATSCRTLPSSYSWPKELTSVEGGEHARACQRSEAEADDTEMTRIWTTRGWMRARDQCHEQAEGEDEDPAGVTARTERRAGIGCRRVHGVHVQLRASSIAIQPSGEILTPVSLALCRRTSFSSRPNTSSPTPGMLDPVLTALSVDARDARIVRARWVGCVGSCRCRLAGRTDWPPKPAAPAKLASPEDTGEVADGGVDALDGGVVDGPSDGIVTASAGAGAAVRLDALAHPKTSMHSRGPHAVTDENSPPVLAAQVAEEAPAAPVAVAVGKSGLLLANAASAAASSP